MKNLARIVLIKNDIYLEITSREGLDYFLINNFAEDMIKPKIQSLTKRFLIDLAGEK
jgi:ABC-type Na+ transport system ATPase subunit NatA